MFIHEILTRHHRALVTRAGFRASRREGISPPGAAALGAPMLLAQLAKAMEGNEREIQRLGEFAARHGEELGRRGHPVAEVVHSYGDIHQALNELARDLELSIPVHEHWRLQTLLEDSLACALTAYERSRAPSAARVAASARAFDYALRHLVQLARLGIESARVDQEADTRLVAGPLGRAVHGLIVLMERRDVRELQSGDAFAGPIVAHGAAAVIVSERAPQGQTTSLGDASA